MKELKRASSKRRSSKQGGVDDDGEGVVEDVENVALEEDPM